MLGLYCITSVEDPWDLQFVTCGWWNHIPIIPWLAYWKIGPTHSYQVMTRGQRNQPTMSWRIFKAGQASQHSDGSCKSFRKCPAAIVHSSGVNIHPAHESKSHTRKPEDCQLLTPPLCIYSWNRRDLMTVSLSHPFFHNPALVFIKDSC